MVGGVSRKEGVMVVNTNGFAALGSLRKKKIKDGKSSSSSRKLQQKDEDNEPEVSKVFWAPTPLNVKSWADVEDEDDDDYYATMAPPLSVWGGADDQSKAKDSLPRVEESDSEEEGLDEVDDDNEEESENEQEPGPEIQKEKEPAIKEPAEVAAPKESERQLSKKELKKKELAELEAMLAEFGYPKHETQDNSHGGAQDKKTENAKQEVDKKENNGTGESKSAKKKKKKDKPSKEAKEQPDHPNGMETENGTDETYKAEEAPAVDVKEKIKKVAASKKKKSSKEMDAAAKAAAIEAAARNAKLAAAKKKEKNHYNQQPTR